MTAALGHNYVDGVCTRCGEADPNSTKTVTTSDVHFEKVTLYAQDQFTDVAANQRFTNKVAEAVELGLIKGSGDTFNPYGDVTLAEAITMARVSFFAISRPGPRSIHPSPAAPRPRRCACRHA